MLVGNLGIWLPLAKTEKWRLLLFLVILLNQPKVSLICIKLRQFSLQVFRISVKLNFRTRYFLEKGFNSDLEVKGRHVHLQTEDWGYENPYLVSRIFSQGAVVRSIKTSYEEVLPRGLYSESQDIRLAMRVQHESILDLLVTGKLQID